MLKRFVFLFLLSAAALSAQGYRFDSQVSQEVLTSQILNTTNVIVVPAAPQIAFCAFPANAVPCTNKATTYTSVTLGTPCSVSTQIVLTGTSSCVASPDAQANWGVWVPSGQYSYTITLPGGVNLGPYVVNFGVPNGTNLVLGSLTTTGPNTLGGGGSLSGTWTGNPTFSGAPIFSGQPNFSAGVNFSAGQSIGSLSFNAGQTTVGGVGITTSQNNVTLETNQSETNGGATGSPSFAVFGADSNRHCATISENNIPGGTPACLAAGQYYTPSAATTSNVSPTTMVTVDAGGTATANTYRLSAYVTQSVLGAACGGTSTIVVNVIFQDPNAAAPQTQAIGTFTITTNGTLGIVPLTTTPGTLMIRAKTGTNVQYSTTYTPNGTCSPNPTYQIFPILEKVN
jgi:hypothetical protein